jgi:hypothetical protein
MSSAILIRQTDAIHIISDAAAYDKNGTVIALAPKSFAIPHMSAALTARGDLAALPLVAPLVSLRKYEQTLSAVYRVLAAAKKANSELELFIGGFMTDGESHAFHATTESVTGAAAPHPPVNDPIYELTNAVTSIPGFAASPMPPADDPIYELIGNRCPDQIDPRVDGLAIIEAQRRHAVDGIFTVGGWATLISVYRDRIEERILTRWPDRIGEPIDPLSSADDVEEPLWTSMISET